jgi:RHS repeat-associated protein
LTTSYSVNALGDRVTQLSPDTGTTAHTYDAAGNVLSSTDAKGQTTSYQYDALNRLTRAQHADGLSYVYGYDACANGVGRLCSISETSSSGALASQLQYGYDPQGRVTAETRTLGGVSYSTGYSYDAAGRLRAMTYPSGRSVNYTLDALGRVTQVQTTGAGATQVLAQSVSYHPFGAARSFSFGNQQGATRSFDLDGRIASHSLGTETKLLAFDAASRVARIETQGNAGSANLYGYDALDRLSSAVLGTSSYGYGYDGVGNRTSKSTGGLTESYSYPATSNRLGTVTSASGAVRNFGHDANGSITSDGLNSFGYDARGRVSSVSSSIGTTTFQVNALGQRVRKTSPLGETVFHYDLSGRLIAESSASGEALREYAWLGEQPIALLDAQLAPGSEVILDNTDAGFTTLGAWPTSTAVAGYLGANYQSHEGGGPPPGAIVIDNTDAGFTTLGTWPTSTAIAGYQGANYQSHAGNGDEPSAIVVDNAAGTAVGTWASSTAVEGYLGANYQSHAAGTGTASFTWTGAIPQAGDYRVYARWSAHPNRATDAKYTVTHAAGESTITVNQQQNGASWNLLGTFSLGAGSAAVSLSDQANGFVVADALKWVPVEAAPNTATWTPSIPAAKDYRVYARWSAHPNRATDAKYTVTHAAGESTITVNQQQNGATWNLLGTFRLVPGAGHRVSLSDQANGFVIADALRFDPADGPAANTATCSPSLAPGQYQVYARWTAHPNRASDAKYTITHSGGQSTISVNQQQAGGAWNLLGTFSLSAQAKVTLSAEANGFVIADALRFVPLAGQHSGSTLYYVHADHLNTPRLITNQSQQAVWRWDLGEPFGLTPPDENPSGLGTFSYYLRFPGQYFDKETNTHYNYFRDYDPAIGRYVQSDPIGLRGGLNTYAYVEGNPLNLTDLFGLVAVPMPTPAPPPPVPTPWPGSSSPPAGEDDPVPGERERPSERPSRPGSGCKFIREVYYGGPCKTCWYQCPGYGGPVTYPQAVGKPCPGIRADGLVDTSAIDPKCYGKTSLNCP